jgi:hypothetical protein
MNPDPPSQCSAADWAALVDLPVLPLRVTARARDPIQLPPHAASSLRGAFGTALKSLVCVHPERHECPGCPEEESCAYPALFEPRAPKDQPGASGFHDLPRPYVVRGSPGDGATPPGETFSWRVTLIGRAADYLPYFALAWREMGEAGIGRGRGRFDLFRVEALDLEGAPAGTLYERETNLLRPPASLIGAPELAAWAARTGAASAEIRFLTPTLLKVRGAPVEVPEFAAFWRSLQLRLSILRLAHGAGRPALDFNAAIRQAEAVRREAWSAVELSWNRYSRRQDRRVPMGGFVGSARYAGELAPFLPALKLGTLVGVGDNCTFGQGECEVSLPDDSS